MKKKIILLLIIFILSNIQVFAESKKNVIYDSATVNGYKDSFDEVNQYTNNFFTPHINKTVKADKTDKNESLNTDNLSTHGSLPPIKKFRLMIKNSRNKAKPVSEQVIEEAAPSNQAILDCDYMEYFADRTELEANGNVVVFFPQNNSTIKADKMIYNQTSNLIKAFGKVVLISDGKELLGDYMQVDMNEENAFINNPQTGLFQIKANAKKGYMYGDKIIQEQGNLCVTKKTMINIKADMFGPDLDAMYVAPKEKSFYKEDSHGEKFKIKTNELIINSKKEHDTLTLKHAEVYFNNKKIGTVPSITMHTNKSQDYVEANFPEIGTVTNLGLFAGPGFVFDTPRGTTLKVVPIFNYDGGGDTPFGYGSIVKFKSATNKVDMAYGTANKTFIMAGVQKLDDNLYFQYGMNRYIDDWFMGYRMPKILGELVYHNSTATPDFFGKDKDMMFSHRIAAAYAQDGSGSAPFLDGEGSVGTMRFKYMAEVAQTLYKLNDIYTSPLNARFDIVGQGSAAVYGTGDTQTIARIGPRIHSQYKSWMQDVGYFLSAYNDNTPLVGYDMYAYGRSNVYLRESYRLCKYLTLSWFGSMNLSNDSWNGKMLQENGFYVAIGPDDVKLNIGYDSVRQQSFVTMAMHLDAKGSTVEYKKMIIKNPDTLGKSKNDDNNQSFSSASSNEAEDGIERAEIIDIKEAL